MAEIELSVFSRACLDRRISDEPELRREVAALESERNEAKSVIDWRFSTQDARSKLQHIYPTKSDCSGFRPAARRSAFMKVGHSASLGRSSIARVVLPAPLGPAIVMILFAGLFVILSLKPLPLRAAPPLPRRYIPVARSGRLRYPGPGLAAARSYRGCRS